MNKVRMVDIANIVGVSKVTVSKVLSQTSGNNTKVKASTAQKILDVARQLSYQPNIAAKQLAGQGANLIGVLIDANSIFNEFPRVVYEEQAASARGYRVIVGQCHPELTDIQCYLDDFLSRGVDGIIMHAHVYPGMTEKIMDACRRFKHVVYYDKPAQAPDDLSCVDVNLEVGMRKLVRHIVETGRKKISYFVPYMRSVPGKPLSYIRRENGFRSAMAEAGLAYDEKFNERYISQIKPDINEMASMVKDLIEREKPEAIVSQNDNVAAVVLRTFQEMGIKCPDDIAVTGSDNRDFAEYLYPRLTTLDNKLALVSCSAVEMLISMIKGNKVHQRQITIEPELIRRMST